MPKDLSEFPYLIVGIGVAAQEEMTRVADRLVDKGRSLTPEGRRKMAAAKKGLVSRGDDFSQVVARTVQRVLENAGIITRADLDELDRKVDSLERSIAGTPAGAPAKGAAAKKHETGRPAGKKPASKKPAGKKPARKKPAGKKPAGKKAAGPGGSPG